MKILVTGGAGYIGSHTVVELFAAGHEVVIIDNSSNSDDSVLERIEQITGKSPAFYQGDLRDKTVLDTIFQEHTIDAVMHFAGLKAVGESVADSIRYYDNNIIGLLTLAECMEAAKVHKIIFSSTACIYGAQEPPHTEDMHREPENPYGNTKMVSEIILQDWTGSNPDLRAVVLRYFNPIGAHKSGLIGENPQGIPNNLLPYIAQVAVGICDHLSVFGDDYDTPDGTGERDFIHVVDLARGHLAALKATEKPGFSVYNLGTGQSTSVLTLLHAFETACGKPIPYEIVDRRPGDVARSFADASKANRELAWHTELSIEQACADTWRWQQYAAEHKL